VFLHHVKKTPMRQKHWVMLRIISTASYYRFVGQLGRKSELTSCATATFFQKNLVSLWFHISAFSEAVYISTA